MVSVANRVLECIEQMPDVNSNDIVELLSDVPRGSVISALSNLYVKRKIVRTETRSPNNRLLYTYRTVSDPSQAPTPKPRKYRPRGGTKERLVKWTPRTSGETLNGVSLKTDFTAGPSKASMRGRIRQLEDEVATLRTWKKEALERYPDLAVDPLVLKARTIVADLLKQSGDTARAEDVSGGRADGTLLVRAVVEGLTRGA